MNIPMMDLKAIKESAFSAFGTKIDESNFSQVIEHLMNGLLPAISEQICRQQIESAAPSASTSSSVTRRKRTSLVSGGGDEIVRKRSKNSCGARSSNGSKKSSSFSINPLDFISLLETIVKDSDVMDSSDSLSIVLHKELIAYFQDYFGQPFIDYYVYRKTAPNFIVQEDSDCKTYGYNIMETKCAMIMNENCCKFTLDSAAEAADNRQELIYLLLLNEMVRLCNNYAISFKFSIDHLKFFLATWPNYVSDSIFNSANVDSNSSSSSNNEKSGQFVMLGGCSTTTDRQQQQQPQQSINISKSNSVASKKAANQKNATSKKKQQISNGTIFQSYVKNMDNFCWKLNSIDRYDYNAILFIIRNRISLPRTVYNRILLTVQPISQAMREKDFESDKEYVAIPCKTFYRGLRILVTPFFIFIQQDMSFQPPSNGLEQDPQLIMLMQKLLEYGSKSFMYLDVFYGKNNEHVILDVLKHDLGNFVLSANDYVERMQTVSETFPFLTVATGDGGNNDTLETKYNGYGFIHMPKNRCAGIPAYYFCNKINLIGAIVGKYKLNYVTVAFREDDDNVSIPLLKSILRINLVGSAVVAIQANEFATAAAAADDEVYIEHEKLGKFKVRRDEEVHYFKNLIPIEIRNLDKFGNVVYDENISKVSEYTLVKRTLDYEAEELEKKVQNRQRKLQQQQQQQQQQKPTEETHKELAKKMEKPEDMQNIVAHMTEEQRQVLFECLKKDN